MGDSPPAVMMLKKDTVVAYDFVLFIYLFFIFIYLFIYLLYIYIYFFFFFGGGRGLPKNKWRMNKLVSYYEISKVPILMMLSSI